jgi:hypothetical protein
VVETIFGYLNWLGATRQFHTMAKDFAATPFQNPLQNDTISFKKITLETISNSLRLTHPYLQRVLDLCTIRLHFLEQML